MDGLQPLIDFVQKHPRLLVITGAGCSTAAGIPDYRDENGAWKQREPMRFQVFTGDPVARKRYWARSMLGWRTMAHAQPTAAHHALAQLERAGRIVQLVTQNVDGLHQAAGSQAVVDLHGRIDTVCCLGCGVRSPRRALQEELMARNPDWLGLDARSLPDGDADLDGLDFTAFEVPDCPQCGGLLKPDVVFFGESVPRERVAAVREALAQADAVLVAGSSLMVYSGYRFVEEAVATGKPVAAVNRGRTRADSVLAFKLEIEVGEAIKTLAVESAGLGPATLARSSIAG
ncbi:NAD-dependent protein deacetylase [Rhodoferax sp. BAB1]|uniref:NAD-dependent protein deacetylase n=1 Tax=Rhodoferax sp. BAB1 TaxID=2741720 RepID=UPI0015765F32|nr:NAD-dependent protein deacetylase [Rhodoferax sp. BAB1]QKO23603.1 NAD-dependent protein deacetylase [Rhodoferax sp. BAB1]